MYEQSSSLSGHNDKDCPQDSYGFGAKGAPKTEMTCPETFTKPINFKVIKTTN